jgi:hypothetical protein
MKICGCGRLLLAAILAAPGASLLCAQNVPPPPKPVPDGPSLDETLESLKQTLLASGKTAYTQKYGNDETDTRFRVTNVTANPAECSMRVNSLRSFGGESPQEIPDSTSYFFEAIDAAEVKTLEQMRGSVLWDSDSSKTSYGYAAVINGKGGNYLEFTDKEAAARVAELFRRASEICRAEPIHLNSGAGNPSLSDTLRFIEQKMNDGTLVSYEFRDAGHSYRSTEQDLDAKAIPPTCQLRYRKVITMNGRPFMDLKMVLSFRRVQKIEVLTEQDYQRRILKQVIGFDPQSVVTPTVYRLLLTDSGGKELGSAGFADEERADRVAKAMNHAAELCGSSKIKEPF